MSNELTAYTCCISERPVRSYELITCAAVSCVVVNITVIGIATANTSAIIFATAIASRLAAAVGTAIVVCTATVIESGHLLSDLYAGCCCLHHDARPDDPSVDSKPDAERGSSSSFPFSSCGYQSRVCYGTL